jgi:acetyl esterase/lipase
VKGGEQRPARMLLVAVFVPVVLLVGVLAAAVLGNRDADSPALGTATAATTATTAPRPLPARAAPPVAIPPPAAMPPAAPPPPAAVPPPAAGPPPVTTTPPAAAPPPAAPPPPAVPPPAAAPAAPRQEPEPGPSLEYAPPGTERVDVGSGAQGAAIFRVPGTAGRPGPVVIFLHGWVAIDPQRYGPWISHLVRGGTTVIYPAYQTKPAYDTITPLANLLAGVRRALEQVRLAPGRLVVAGHSAGGALSADYAAVATANGLPAPAAVFSVYPGRKLRHLTVPIPAANLAMIAPGTRVLVFAGERDTAVGSVTAHRIVTDATRADTTLRIIRDDAVDEHSDPRMFDGIAQQTFWRPLDELVAATARTSRGGAAPSGRR